MVRTASKSRFGLWTRPLIPAFLVWMAVLAGGFYGVHRFLMPWVAGRFKPTVAVPNLKGLTQEAAASAARAQRLQVVLDSVSDFNNKIPAGHILYQFPDAGTVVKIGRRLWVRLSKGPQAIDMPDLRGQSERQAEISLEQLGLRLGEVHYVTSRSVPAGAVLGSEPGPHTALQKGRVINISVSAGSEGGPSMPSLLGLSLDQAKSQIAALHLSLGTVHLQTDKKNTAQTVLAQNPRPGAPLKEGKGEEVDLDVAK